MFLAIIKAIGAIPAIFEGIQKLYQWFVDQCQANYLAAKEKELNKSIDSAQKPGPDGHKSTKDIDDFYRK